jgi:tripartite-type tricarboxylate transporter receptor subunit TctC
MKSATVLIAQAVGAVQHRQAELVAYAKANPGKLNFASYSAGSTSHLNGELLMQRTGIQMVHVPYKGTADATRALLAGEVQLYFDGTSTAIPQIKGGRMKAWARPRPSACRCCPTCRPSPKQGVPASTSSAGRACSAPATWRPSWPRAWPGAAPEGRHLAGDGQGHRTAGREPSGTSGPEPSPPS